MLAELEFIIILVAVIIAIAVPDKKELKSMFDKKDPTQQMTPGPAPSPNELVITVYKEGDFQNQVRVTTLSELVENIKFIQDQAKQSSEEAEVVGQMVIKKKNG